MVMGLWRGTGTAEGTTAAIFNIDPAAKPDPTHHLHQIDLSFCIGTHWKDDDRFAPVQTLHLNRSRTGSHGDIKCRQTTCALTN